MPQTVYDLILFEHVADVVPYIVISQLIMSLQVDHEAVGGAAAPSGPRAYIKANVPSSSAAAGKDDARQELSQQQRRRSLTRGRQRQREA